MTRLGLNLFATESSNEKGERIDVLVSGNGLRLERIISQGHRSPDGFWYDQSENEWVLVLSGHARVRIEGQPSEITMAPGDTLLLPAHCRHRVEWTDPDQQTIWLALFTSCDLK